MKEKLALNSEEKLISALNNKLKTSKQITLGDKFKYKITTYLYTLKIN
jgi:hypothetical protein